MINNWIQNFKLEAINILPQLNPRRKHQLLKKVNLLPKPTICIDLKFKIILGGKMWFKISQGVKTWLLRRYLVILLWESVGDPNPKEIIKLGHRRNSIHKPIHKQPIFYICEGAPPILLIQMQDSLLTTQSKVVK